MADSWASCVQNLFRNWIILIDMCGRFLLGIPPVLTVSLNWQGNAVSIFDTTIQCLLAISLNATWLGRRLRHPNQHWDALNFFIAVHHNMDRQWLSKSVWEKKMGPCMLPTMFSNSLELSIIMHVGDSILLCSWSCMRFCSERESFVPCSVDGNCKNR